MGDYGTKLIDRKLIAENTLACYFEKPEGYEFHAGQYCFLTLPDKGYRDERGLRRHLTLASSPLEDHLLFATRMSGSAFKKTLGELITGERITIEDPLGNFTLPEDPSVPLVFITGGIGITPFRSMIRYVSDAGTKHVITLIYSNRTPEAAAFLDEFESIAAAHDSITMVPTMTQTEDSNLKWNGLAERINPPMIRDNVQRWDHAVFYIAGPPKMVDYIHAVMLKMHVARERIHIEKFPGYE